MHSPLHRIALAACALCLSMACGASSAAPQARLVSSIWLPGGKYALVYECEGVQYMTLSADPPASVAPRAEVFPESHSYVGGFFIDPLSAALHATGLGLLLGGDWPRLRQRPGH